MLIKVLRTITKLLVATLFYYSGLFYLVRIFNNVLGRRLTIVTYHRVTDGRLDQIEYSLPFLFVTEDTFTKHLRFFKKHYEIISFKDLEDNANNRKLPCNSLIITFDDGYEDNFSRAYPILRKQGVASTMFLATNLIDDSSIPWWDEVYCRLHLLSNRSSETGNPHLSNRLNNILGRFKDDSSGLFRDLNKWEKAELEDFIDSLKEATLVSENMLSSENKFMTWGQTRKMQGAVDFGSHTCSHIQLDGLSIEAIRIEVTRSKQELEKKLGEKVNTFSYPAGSYTEEAKRLVAESGYSYAVTTDRGLDDMKDKYALKRINIWEGTALAWGKFSKVLFSAKLVGL